MAVLNAGQRDSRSVTVAGAPAGTVGTAPALHAGVPTGWSDGPQAVRPGDFGRGSSQYDLVGVEGFEPPTPWM